MSSNQSESKNIIPFAASHFLNNLKKIAERKLKINECNLSKNKKGYTLTISVIHNNKQNFFLLCLPEIHKGFITSLHNEIKSQISRS